MNIITIIAITIATIIITIVIKLFHSYSLENFHVQD